MLHMVRRLAIAAALIPAAGPAQAGKITSVYTGLDLKKDCRLLRQSDEGSGFAEWRCKGYQGLPVRVVEGDLRFYVSFGPNAENQLAARQTVTVFNYLHKTLEWRLQERGGKAVPFATILRYFAEADGFKAQYLVVTRLDGEEACQVGHVRADGNAGANETARELADTVGRNGPCPQAAIPVYGPGLKLLEQP